MAEESHKFLMTQNSLKSVGITSSTRHTGLSKRQKTFNTLIEKIKKRRAALQAWDVVTPAVQQKYVNELLPLVKTFDAMQVQFVQALDQSHAQKGLSKIERRMVSEIIAALAGGLAQRLDDATMKAIYNRHSGSDLDSEIAAEIDSMKQAMEEAFDIDLGEDDMSIDDILERAEDQIEQKIKDEDAREKSRKERQAQRKKTAKQVAHEEKERAAQAQLSLSIREVYRKLASALHPDRETDLDERARKTSLMQRVNQAYEKNDLLALLELQLELEHIDQTVIDNISDSRLQHYNQILKEQVGELDRELMHTESRFRDQFDLHPFMPLTPKTALRTLVEEIEALRGHVRTIKADTLVCKDIRKLKVQLKSWHHDMCEPDFDAMDEIFDGIPF